MKSTKDNLAQTNLSARTKPNDHGQIKTGPVPRRTLLEWLGKGAVLGLGGSLFAACDLADPDEISPGSDNSGENGEDDTGESERCFETDDPLFSPTDPSGKLFDNWGERTVDEQDLDGILKSWRLRIDGLVENPLELSFHELLGLARQDQISDFHCVEGWTIRDVPWNGVHLTELFEKVRPLSSATHLTVHTLGDKYNESIPLDVAQETNTLLAYGINCQTLPLKHGFPLRLVVPRKWAYKSAKFVYRLELDNKPINGYWVERGYPYDADVPQDKLRPAR